MATMIAATRVSRWTSRTAVAGLQLTFFAMLSGAITGLVFDGLALLLGRPLNVVASIVAAVACVIGVVTGRNPPQRDRETPQRWLKYGGWRTAASSGALLGSGVFTRIGYWSFLMMPALILAASKVGFGMLLFAIYGATRVALSWTLSFLLRSRCHPPGGLFGRQAARSIDSGVVGGALVSLIAVAY